MKVFFLAIEAHVNAIAAAILSEPGMKRLMDVPDDAGLPFLMRRIIFVDQEDL